MRVQRSIVLAKLSTWTIGSQLLPLAALYAYERLYCLLLRTKITVTIHIFFRDLFSVW